MTYNLIQYEWDIHKNNQNRAKHGIDSQDAIEIFQDYHRLECVDMRRNYGEIRYQTIGMVNGFVLVAVYTLRKTYSRRIISVRRAAKTAREIYYENLQKQIEREN